MEKSNAQIGMTFDQDLIRYIVAESGPIPALLSAGEIKLDRVFDYGADKDENQIIRQAAAVNRIIGQSGFAAIPVSFAVNQSCFLLKRLRVDLGLSENELRRHIEWEMEQFLIAPRDEYNVSYERTNGDSERFEFFVVAAMRKSVIRQIQAVFAGTKAVLKSIDVNTLSALRGLPAVVDAVSVDLSGTIHVSDNKLHISLLKNGHFLSSQTTTLLPTQELTTSHSGRAEEIAHFINDELLRLLDALSEQVLLKNIDQLFFADKEISRHVVAALQPLLGTTEIITIDPLQKLPHSLNTEAERIIRDSAGSFLPIIGLFFA